MNNYKQYKNANYGLLRDYDNKAAISITAVAQLNPEKSDIADFRLQKLSDLLKTPA